jgi:chemotaxis regulatin CheY-phosphate phosphatase CheZ
MNTTDWRIRRPDFPSMDRVEKADHEQLARWSEYMPLGLENDEMKQIVQRIEERLNAFGGITPEIRTKIDSRTGY